MPSSSEFQIDLASRELLARERLDSVELWMSDERVDVWRDIRERQNGTIELAGQRYHVKRLRPPHGRELSAEVQGIRLLEAAGIATVPLVAWGVGERGEGVLVTRDLTGYIPADQRLGAGASFDDLAKSTARVAGRLHGANLHHRDLYLCHFLVNDAGEVRLIDAARVRPIPWLTRRRWIVKDLAQFRYSGLQAGVDAPQLDEWLDLWASEGGFEAGRLRAAVKRKTARIARHNVRLLAKHPERHVSLPAGGSG